MDPTAVSEPPTPDDDDDDADDEDEVDEEEAGSGGGRPKPGIASLGGRPTGSACGKCAGRATLPQSCRGPAPPRRSSAQATHTAGGGRSSMVLPNSSVRSCPLSFLFRLGFLSSAVRGGGRNGSWQRVYTCTRSRTHTAARLVPRPVDGPVLPLLLAPLAPPPPLLLLLPLVPPPPLLLLLLLLLPLADAEACCPVTAATQAECAATTDTARKVATGSPAWASTCPSEPGTCGNGALPMPSWAVEALCSLRQGPHSPRQVAARRRVAWSGPPA